MWKVLLAIYSSDSMGECLLHHRPFKSIDVVDL
jgi:hypothetical protein